MKAVCIMISTIILSGAAASAQISEPVTLIGSMHGIVGARNAALGESSVAALGDPGAWNSNPATIAGTRGAGGHFMLGHRSALPDRYGTDWKGAGAWLAAPLVSVAIHYVREDLGQFQQTFENGDQGTLFDAYDQTITMTFGTTLLGSLSVGANVEWVNDRSTTMVAISEEMMVEGSGVWFDFGAIYSTPGFMKRGTLRDNARIGAAIQDIGGDIAYRDIAQSSKVAQWLRVGGTYDIAVGDSASPTLRAAVSAEYKRMLNGSPSLKRSYGGIGLEVTAFDIASLRIGARFHPVIFREDRSSTTVFGAGVNLPLKRIGVDIPLVIGVDYAKLPAWHFASSDDPERSLLEFRMAYTGSLFE